MIYRKYSLKNENNYNKLFVSFKNNEEIGC